MVIHLPYAGAYCLCRNDIVDFVTRTAVPSFFAISGFLLAVKSGYQGWYVTALRKRLHSLLIPYLCLNTMYAIFKFVFYNTSQSWGASGDVSFGLVNFFQIYGISFTQPPASGVLWYIRCLMIFVIISPLVIIPVRRSIGVCALYLSLMTLAVSFLDISKAWRGNILFYLFFNLKGFVFFSFGAAIAYWGDKIPRIKRRLVFGLSLLCVAILMHIFYAFPFLDLASIMMLSLGIWHCVPAIPLPKILISSSFPIYVLHPLLFVIYRVLVVRSCGLRFESMYMAWLPIIYVVAICCFITYVFHRRFRIVSEIMFGNRI